MKLSIGMIVKNEEKNLRRCLEAMRPILRQIDSELIIADTGSTDDTVTIAREFTENVFHFEWCDDFAAARNATIAKATGEWYMAVDADEFFVDTKPLIEFFNSGEYQKYNAATITIRNYPSSEMGAYSDSDALRLTRLTKDTRYQNPIHEYLNVQKPIKILPLVADHTGYIWEDREFAERKAERNLSLLLPLSMKNPKDPKILLEVGQSYIIKQEYDSAILHLRKGLRHAKEIKHIVQYCFYAELVSCYTRGGKYREALDTISEYFQSRKTTLATDLKMYCSQFICFCEIGDHRAAANACETYMRIFAEYQRGLHHTMESLHYPISYADNASYQAIVNQLIPVYFAAYEYETAINKTMKIPDTPACTNRELVTAFDRMNQTGDFQPLIALYDQLNETQRNLFQKITEKGLASEKYRDTITSAVSRQDMGADYMQLLALRCSHEKGALRTEKILSFIGSVTEWKPTYADAVYFALKYKTGIGLLAEKIDGSDLAQYLTNTPYLHYSDLPDMLMSLCEDHGAWEKETVKAQLFLSVLFHWALTTHRFSGECETRLFTAFAQTCKHYINAVFKAEFLTEERAGVLPKLFRLGYHSSRVIETYERKEYVPCLRALKQVVACERRFMEIVKTYKVNIQNEMETPRDNHSELQDLGVKVKENIRLLMRQGEYPRAALLLDEYAKICPGDESIAVIREELSEKAG